MDIFKEASIFLIIVHSNCELFCVQCFAFHHRAELKPACILLLIVTVIFVTCLDFLIYLHVAEPALSLSSVKKTILLTHASELKLLRLMHLSAAIPGGGGGNPGDIRGHGAGFVSFVQKS